MEKLLGVSLFHSVSLFIDNCNDLTLHVYQYPNKLEEEALCKTDSGIFLTENRVK